MLVLTRRIGESLLIGKNIRIVVIRFADGGVKLGIEAPKEIPVLRAELLAAKPASTSEESRTL